MKNKTTLYITTITIASILLTSGFGISSAHAQTSNTASVRDIFISAQTQTVAGTSSVAYYNYIFEVCAKKVPLRSPEVIISSDTEVKSVKLARSISANTCEMTGAKIKAGDQSTIGATIVGKEGLSEQANALEVKIADLRGKIQEQKAKLKSYAEFNPNEKQKLITESIDKISDLRKELREVKSDYHRILYLIHK